MDFCTYGAGPCTEYKSKSSSFCLLSFINNEHPDFILFLKTEGFLQIMLCYVWPYSSFDLGEFQCQFACKADNLYAKCNVDYCIFAIERMFTIVL